MGFAFYLTQVPTYQLVYGTLAALAGVPDLDLSLLADRAGRRRDHGDAGGAHGRCGAARRPGRAGADGPERRSGTLSEAVIARSGAARLRRVTACRIGPTSYLARLFIRLRSALTVWSLIQAAGWPIWPLIFASIIALALIFERLWSLRQSAVAPAGMVDRVLAEYRQGGATPDLCHQDRAAGAARAHPGRGPRQRQEPAPGDEGGDRGSRPRRHARSRALPHHARHDRRDGAAAGPVRHRRRA